MIGIIMDVNNDNYRPPNTNIDNRCYIILGKKEVPKIHTLQFFILVSRFRRPIPCLEDPAFCFWAQFSDSNLYSGVELRPWTFQWDLTLHLLIWTVSHINRSLRHWIPCSILLWLNRFYNNSMQVKNGLNEIANTQFATLQANVFHLSIVKIY